MARPKTEFIPPSWFRLASYDKASSMDAADWYLNLKLRFRLARHLIEEDAAQHILKRFVRGGHPLLQREDQLGFEFLGIDVGPELASIIAGRAPKSGVYPLRVEELYFFEKRLPQEMRDFGSIFVPGRFVRPAEVPAGFTAPLDHAFERRMTTTFARIDLTNPDKVLMEHFAEFIASKRSELASRGGSQPYKEAIDFVRTKKRAHVETFAKLRLLAHLDLKAWVGESGKRIADTNWADVLELDSEDSVREVRRLADQLMKPFVIDSWLAEPARLAMRTP